MSTNTGRTAEAPRHAGVVIDIESPRRDAVADDLLGDSHNTAIDRMFADALVAEQPQLPSLAIAAATFDRDAAQTMLDHGLRQFLVLGTGGLPISARSSTLTDLHEAGARIVVIEHDPITRHLHDLIDHGAAADRAHVLCLPANRHHSLTTEPSVTQLLTAGEPLGILATGPLRPASLPLATILSLLDDAPPGSLAAISQLTDTHRGDNPVCGHAARFAQAGIPIAVEDQATTTGLLLGDYAHLTVHAELPIAANRDAMTPVLTTALLARRQPRTTPRPTTAWRGTDPRAGRTGAHP